MACVVELKPDTTPPVLRSGGWPSHPDAWRYRTRLRAALGKPPDFAARYVVVLIGCGTCCEWVALIDVETGRVHFAPFATSLGGLGSFGESLDDP